MTGFAFAIPGDLTRASGGYAYDRRVMLECRLLGAPVTHLPLPDGFPTPSQDELTATAGAFTNLPEGEAVLVDGLAFGALPPELLRASGRRFAALVHHPLALESGLSPEAAEALAAGERAALAEAAAVIVPSPAIARVLTGEFGVEPERITVAPPGVDPAERATGGGDAPLILAVGAVIPRKDYSTLVEALARLRDRSWRCLIIGATNADPDEAGRVASLISARGLQQRIRLAGQVEQAMLARAYRAADLFALPSLYEGYGMAFSEALAHGLPVVAVRAGAVPDTVPDDAGLLVEPGDVAAFSSALAGLLDSPEARQRLAEAAWRRAAGLPRWPETAAAIMRVMASLAGG